jgi:hypothetical protein
MPILFNQFDSGVTTALIARLLAYLETLPLDIRARVVNQYEQDVQSLPLIVVSQTELEEVVYQSGNYRVALDVSVRVDMDSGNPAQFTNLSAAVLDALQQDDLIAQLNAETDAAGSKLCIVKGIVLEQSRLEEVGERQWRRVYALNVYGCAVG